MSSSPDGKRGKRKRKKRVKSKLEQQQKQRKEGVAMSVADADMHDAVDADVVASTATTPSQPTVTSAAPQVQNGEHVDATVVVHERDATHAAHSSITHSSVDAPTSSSSNNSSSSSSSSNNNNNDNLQSLANLKCVSDALLAPLRDGRVDESARRALFDSASRCAVCTALLVVLLERPVPALESAPTLAAPAAAYTTARAWLERCDSLSLLASLTRAVAVEQLGTLLRGGEAVCATLAHLVDCYNKETAHSSSSPSSIPSSSSSSSSSSSLVFRCGSIEKVLDKVALHDLRDGSSIRASLVDCYYEYCVHVKYSKTRGRVFCMAAAYAQQLLCAGVTQHDEETIAFVVEAVRTQMAMCEAASGVPIKLLLLPVALPGHVTLFAAYLAPGSTALVYIDSMNGRAPLYLIERMKHLLGERVEGLPVVKTPEVPQQYGADCGLHTMFYGEQFVSCIARDADLSVFDYAQSNRMRDFRRTVYQVLMAHCV